MNKYVVRVNRDTGNLAIVVGRMADEYIAEALNINVEDLTEEQIESFVLNDSNPELFSASYLVSPEDLPPEFDNFQDCSIWKDGKVDFDLEKARSLQIARIRLAREPLLEALDVEFMIALENNLPTNDIVKRKQELRDVTENLKVKQLNSISDVTDESEFPANFTVPKSIAECIPYNWEYIVQ